ncbi:MAG: tetratricopeptide repeat protein [Kibdelosporangium sp.]
MDRRRPSGAPAHIGVSDVERLEAGTVELRAVDYQFGGGSCHRAVLSRLPRARSMLAATMPVTLTRRLDTAVADLHNLAGWTLFDTGSVTEALRHFGSALDLAARAGNEELAANIRYRIGRIHLHHDCPGRALAEFELGRRAASSSPGTLPAAILSANVAWAYAKLGCPQEAIAALGRMQNEYAAADPAEVPSWATFFTDIDVAAMIGSVYTDLARFVDPVYARRAVPALQTAVDHYGDRMIRSRVFCLISLAVNRLLLHDVDQAVDTGRDALVQGRTVQSVRLLDRLRPLENEARKWGGAGELTEQIRTMLPAAS